VKTDLTKFDEHKGCYAINEESKMLITLDNEEKSKKDGIKVHNFFLC